MYNKYDRNFKRKMVLKNTYDYFYTTAFKYNLLLNNKVKNISKGVV